MHTARSGRARGAIAGVALLVSLGVGVAIDSTAPSGHPQSASCRVFAGRSGSLPCSKSDPTSRAIGRDLATFGAGCLSGLIAGGPAGIAPGCFSGALGTVLIELPK